MRKIIVFLFCSLCLGFSIKAEEQLCDRACYTKKVDEVIRINLKSAKESPRQGDRTVGAYRVFILGEAKELCAYAQDEKYHQCIAKAYDAKMTGMMNNTKFKGLCDYVDNQSAFKEDCVKKAEEAQAVMKPIDTTYVQSSRADPKFKNQSIFSNEMTTDYRKTLIESLLSTSSARQQAQVRKGISGSR